MILHFIRRDPAWKFMPAFAVAAAGAAFFYSSRHSGALMGVVFGALTMAVMQAMPHRRANFFEAALPVSGRDLFVARLLSLLAMVWLPGAAAAAVLLSRGNGAETVSAIALTATVLTLAMIVSLSVRVKEFAAPTGLTVACAAGAAAVIAFVLSLGHPVPVAAVCGVAAVKLVAVIWKSVPEAFQCAPVEPTAARTKTGNAAPSIPWWPIIRSLFPWQTAVMVPMGGWFVSTGQWVFGPMYLMMAYSQTRVTAHWTLGLPISRRAMLAAATVPMLLVVACGAEVGMVSGFAEEGRNLVRLGDPDHFRATGAMDVIVNRAFWRRAPGGRTAAIQSPWGETFQPAVVRILGLAVYNPYAVGQSNSLRFEEWQFARATAEIYGRPYTAREVATAKQGALQPITLSPRMQVLSVALVLAIALCWAWLIEAVSWRGLRRLSDGVRNTVTYSAVLIPSAGVLALEFVDRGPGSLTRSALEGGLLFASRHLPDNLVLVALATVIPLAALSWILDRQHAVAELCQKVQPGQGIFNRGSWPR